MSFHTKKASQSGTSAPTAVTPEFIGQVYVDTTGPTLYIAHGTSEGNWTEAESGAISAHDIGGSSHNADTLANLNSKISDDDIIGKNAFDANTILAADSDNTPAALTVAEQTLVGRITSGNIDALTATEVRTLLNVEDGADVTDSTNVDAAGAVMNSDASTAAMSFVIDDDTMATASDTTLATSESIKAYVDAAVASEVTYQGGYNAATNSPDLDTSPSGVSIGDMYTVTAAGTFFTTDVEIGDVLIAEANDASTEAEWTIVNKNMDAASIKTAYESNADTNAFTDDDHSKLDGIEALADVTDATNVNAAGAVMEADYNAHTILAATSDDTPVTLTVAEQTLVGRITSGNIDALTATEVRTLLNVEDGADVTDATNVNAAGAVMESDYDANTILAATSDNTPVTLTVAEQTLVGRITSGNIDALTATEVRTLLNVEDGADVTDATNVEAAGAQMVNEDLDAKVYSQASQPTLDTDGHACWWVDTDDSNRVYLMYRRGTGDYVGVELT